MFCVYSFFHCFLLSVFLAFVHLVSMLFIRLSFFLCKCWQESIRYAVCIEPVFANVICFVVVILEKHIYITDCIPRIFFVIRSLQSSYTLPLDFFVSIFLKYYTSMQHCQFSTSRYLYDVLQDNKLTMLYNCKIPIRRQMYIACCWSCFADCFLLFRTYYLKQFFFLWLDV